MPYIAVEKILETLFYRYLFQSLSSFPLGIYSGAELLGHTVILYLTFLGISCYFPQPLHHFTFLLAMYMDPISKYPHQHLGFLVLTPTITFFLLSMKSYLIAVLICISLMTDVDFLFMCLPNHLCIFFVLFFAFFFFKLALSFCC